MSMEPTSFCVLQKATQFLDVDEYKEWYSKVQKKHAVWSNACKLKGEEGWGKALREAWFLEATHIKENEKGAIWKMENKEQDFCLSSEGIGLPFQACAFDGVLGSQARCDEDWEPMRAQCGVCEDQ